MEGIIQKFEQLYYTDPILIGVLIVAISISLKRRKKFRLLKYFPIYMSFLLVAFVLNDIWVLLNPRYFFFPIAQYADYFFTLLELVLFSNFYYHLLNNHAAKKSIIVVNIAFTFFFIYMGLTEKDIYWGVSENTQAKVYTVEAVLLLLICLLYFFELFKNLPIVNLKNEPAFWVSSGLFFFMACTLPYSFLENYIEKNHPDFYVSTYSIFYVFYILLFLMIIRAYLCKPVTQG